MDQAVYYKETTASGSMIIVAVYVDDCTIAASVLRHGSDVRSTWAKSTMVHTC